MRLPNWPKALQPNCVAFEAQAVCSRYNIDGSIYKQQLQMQMHSLPHCNMVVQHTTPKYLKSFGMKDKI